MRLRWIYDRSLVVFVFVLALSLNAGSAAWGGGIDKSGGSFLVADSSVIYNTNGGIGEGYVGRPHKKRPPRVIEPLDESFLDEGYSVDDDKSAVSTSTFKTNGGLGEGYVGRPHKKRAPRTIAFPEEKAKPIKSTVIYTTGDGNVDASGGSLAPGWQPDTDYPLKAFFHRIFPGRNTGEAAKPSGMADEGVHVEDISSPAASPAAVITTTDGDGKAASGVVMDGGVTPGYEASEGHLLCSVKSFFHKLFPGGGKDKEAVAASEAQKAGCDRAPVREVSDKTLSSRRAERTSHSSTAQISTVEDTQAAEVAIVALDNEDDLAFDDEFDNGTEAEDQIVADPLEGFNRAMFVVNDRLYFWFFRPVASGYSKLVPEPGRVAVRRFFANVFMPIRFANNVLQLKFKYAGIELERFVINTTIGVGGLMDPAKEHWNLVMHEEDFGQTLGFYGFGPGVYINLPIFGPSNIRDTVGRVADIFLSPTAYILPNDREIVVGINAFEKLNEVSLDIGLYEDIKRDALDPYIFIRNAYQQHRDSLIKE